MTLQQILAWVESHWWPILSAVLLMVLRSRTPEAWVALGERSPRAQGLLKMLRGAGLDPHKVIAGFIQAVTGRAPARAVQIADTVQRATQAPPPPSDPQRGAVRVGALLAICGAVVVASVVGAVLTACDPIREGVMRVTPGVPEPSVCVPDSHRCAGAVPEVCSQSSMGNTRWWPSLSLRADGTQRVCSSGCVVDDAGVAGCASPDASVSAASDGGAL